MPLSSPAVVFIRVVFAAGFSALPSLGFWVAMRLSPTSALLTTRLAA
jgi:hypothetical protein